VRLVRMPFAVCEISTVWLLVNSVPFPRMKSSRFGICSRSEGTSGLSRRKCTLSKMMKMTCSTSPCGELRRHVLEGSVFPCDCPADAPLATNANDAATANQRTARPANCVMDALLVYLVDHRSHRPLHLFQVDVVTRVRAFQILPRFSHRHEMFTKR